MKQIITLSLFCLLGITQLLGQVTYYWRSEASNGSWNVDNNWWNGTTQVPQGADIIVFGNDVYPSMTNNLTATNRYRIFFDAAANVSRTINGTSNNTFYDYSSNMPKIENNSLATHIINFPITIGYVNGCEFNPVAGDLIFGGDINNGGNNIILYGGKNISFNGTVSGTGKIIVNQGTIAKLFSSSTITGDIEINQGEFWICENSALGSGSIYIGNGDQTSNVAKLFIADMNGGTTINRNIVLNNGDETTRVIGALNTEGVNTYNGLIDIGSNTSPTIIYSKEVGGTVQFAGVISGDRNVRITEPGKVIFSAENTFGTNSILYIDNGVLELNHPSGDVLDVKYIKLGNTVNDVTLLLNSSVGITLDDNGGNIEVLSTSGTKKIENGSGANIISAPVVLTNHVTYCVSGGALEQTGIISGSGNLTKTGTGVLKLSAENSYTGNTIITQGTIELGASDRISNSSNLDLNGGKFKTSGFSETFNKLILTDNSEIELSASSHTLTFSASNLETWTDGKILTITNWTGNAGESGTAGKIIVGVGGLTTSQLEKINFYGYDPKAMILPSGELVPYYECQLSLTEPSSQASNLIFSNLYINSLTLSWDNGNGANRIVVASTASITGIPTDNTTYQANSTFGSGDALSSGEYIVYNGNESSVSITGLSENTMYYFKVFEYNGTGCPFNGENYATNGMEGSKATISNNIISIQDGIWSEPSTWSTNTIPHNGSVVTIDHSVTVDVSNTNSPSSISINTDKILLFENVGSITTTTLTNSGTISMVNGGLLTILSGGSLTNNGTFTGNNGKVSFAGSGTVSGTITFNDVDVSGGVDFGTNAALNGTLNLLSGAYLTNNSITYNSGSTLRYSMENYDIGNTDKAWYSNTPNNGSAQIGVPWNIEISGSSTVQLNNNYPFYINGNITINGTFRLGTYVDPNAGDLVLRGNFINNGVFNNNDRAVQFNGNVNQVISGTQPIDFEWLNINNSAGVTLQRELSCSGGRVQFNNGKIYLGDYDFIVNNGYEFNTDSKYFVTNGSGYLIQNVTNSDVVYPIGTETIFAPATLNQAGTAEKLGARVTNTISNPVNDENRIVNLQWDLNESIAANNDLFTNFQWNELDEAGSFSNIETVVIGRFLAGYYHVMGSSVTGAGPYLSSASFGIKSNILGGMSFVVGNTNAFSTFGSYVTQRSGDWNNVTSGSETWLCECIPPIGANVTIDENHIVSLNQDVTLTSLTINNNGELVFENSTPRSITFGEPASESITNNGTFTANNGKVVFASFGLVAGSNNTVFNEVEINGAVNFGTISIIGDGNEDFPFGYLQINPGGSVFNNPPIYSNNSRLIYNQGGNISRSYEWKENVNIGVGYPALVEISGNTLLSANTTNTLFNRGLIINTGSSFSLNSDATNPIIVAGDVTNAGTFNFSGENGGDLKLTGHLTNIGTGSINWTTDADFGRAVFFNGTNVQNVEGVPSIPFIIIENSAILTLQNNMAVNGDGTNFLTLNGTAELDLRGHTLTSTASGRIVVDGANATIRKITSSQSNGRLVFTGISNGTVFPENSGELLIDTDVTIAIEGGKLDLGINGTIPITHIYGTLEIRGIASIVDNHYPKYYEGSTLKYVNIEDVTTSGEWPNTDGPTNLWIACATDRKVILNENKAIGANGSLIIQSGNLDLTATPYTLTYNSGSKLDYRIGAGNTYTIDNTKAQEWQETAPKPDNVIITSGTVIINEARSITSRLSILSNGKIELAAGTGQLSVVDIDNAGEFRIKSPLNTGATGSLITTGIITDNGTMVAERWLEGFRYQYVCPSSIQSISDSLTRNPNGYFNPNVLWWDEQEIANGTLPVTPVYSDWALFLHSWKYFQRYSTSATHIFNVKGQGVGYYNDLNRIVNFKGTFNSLTSSENQPLPVMYHNNDNSQGYDYFDGWNLVGNPFPCAIDWSDVNWTRNNVSNVIYFWKGTNSNNGNYSYYTLSDPLAAPDPSNRVNAGSSIIPAMQGFFVKATGENPELVIPSSARIHNNAVSFNKSQSEPYEYVRLQASLGTNTDETVIRFRESATSEIDNNFDAYKMYSNAQDIPQIYSMSGAYNIGLAINSIPPLAQNMEIPLGFLINKTGSVTCTISATELYFENYRVYLKDNDQLINIKEQPSYTFVATGPTDIRGRFSLYFEINQAPIANLSLSNQEAVYNQTFSYILPQNMFTDPENEDITISVSLNDNSVLPSWLQYDSESQTFSGTPDLVSNYTIKVTGTDIMGASTSLSFDLNIAKANQVITFEQFENKVYGDSDFSLEANSTSNLVVDFQIDNPDVAIVQNGIVNIVGAGTCSITALQEGNECYNSAEPITRTLNITKANLIIGVNDVTRNFGEANPAFELNYTGFVYNENSNVLEQLPIANCSASTSSLAGTYVITVTGGWDNNYNYNLTNGILTIQPIIPSVNTIDISGITNYSAVVNCCIISEGGDNVFNRGVCWSTSQNPVIIDNYLANGSGIGDFYLTIDGLQPATTYFIRAYGENSAGVGYGNQLEINTMPLGINSGSEQQWIYPNPSNGSFFINLTEADKTIIEISDANGKLVYSSIVNSGITFISIRNLNDGVYNVKLLSEKKTKIKKLIIKK